MGKWPYKYCIKSANYGAALTRADEAAHVIAGEGENR
jgi:hypothetical protein